MAPNHRGSGKPIRTLIVGVPNVGKSTLINTLAGRKVAKTGNEPAITKQQQEIDISRCGKKGDGDDVDVSTFAWPKRGDRSPR